MLPAVDGGKAEHRQPRDQDGARQRGQQFRQRLGGGHALRGMDLLHAQQPRDQRGMQARDHGQRRGAGARGGQMQKLGHHAGIGLRQCRHGDRRGARDAITLEEVGAGAQRALVGFIVVDLLRDDGQAKLMGMADQGAQRQRGEAQHVDLGELGPGSQRPPGIVQADDVVQREAVAPAMKVLDAPHQGCVHLDRLQQLDDADVGRHRLGDRAHQRATVHVDQQVPQRMLRGGRAGQERAIDQCVGQHGGGRVGTEFRADRAVIAIPAEQQFGRDDAARAIDDRLAGVTNVGDVRKVGCGGVGAFARRDGRRSR